MFCWMFLRYVPFPNPLRNDEAKEAREEEGGREREGEEGRTKEDEAQHTSTFVRAEPR